MKYSVRSPLLGLGRLERQRLSELLTNTKTAINVEQAADIWEMDRSQSAKLLYLYNKKGWLKRVTRGFYIPIPLSSQDSEIISDEPFAMAEEIFSPCYIGGVNAANYWDLTEQIFRTVTVMTGRILVNRTQFIAGIEYRLHTLKPKYFFGIKNIWINGAKIKISDPTRTLIDMLAFPQFSGEIRFIEEVLKNYFSSKHKNTKLFIEYINKLGNGAVIKRLGFLLEINFPNESILIDYCANNITAGYAKLSPSLDCKKLITRWHLWVPDNWKEKLYDK